jgi:ribose-phosphate pyrophosphokinase
MNKPLVLGFPEYEVMARRLAAAAGLDYAGIDIHRFPDGESKLTLPSRLPASVILCRSLDHPNDKLVELVLAASGARKLGAECLTLVAPYLGYMRQDKAFHPGEVVSQKVIGQLLAEYIDGLITVDAHLHRISRLDEAVPVDPAINLHATEAMAGFLRARIDNPFLIGPDGESEQWVAEIARHDGWDYRVATKERFGDRDVRIHLPEAGYQGRHLVLVDDVASTGRTLLGAAEQLRAFAPASISVLVTHALFVGDALQSLTDIGIENIWSCDSVPHSTNAVHLDTLLARHL